MIDSYFYFPQTGKLVIEQTLFSSYQPILFTCRSDKGNLFLCVCCGADNGFQKWLLSETEPATIIEMLEDKITLRDAFLKDNKGRYTISRDRDGNESVTCNDPSDWHPEDSFLLPTPSEYMDADEGEFSKEIQFYRLKQLYSKKMNQVTIATSTPLKMSSSDNLYPEGLNAVLSHKPRYDERNNFITHKTRKVNMDNILLPQHIEQIDYDMFTNKITISYETEKPELFTAIPIAS